MASTSNYRSDQQLSHEFQTIRTNTDIRKVKDEINDISQIATSSRPLYEILRPNSPTFKRLVAVRIKLDKYFSSQSKIISPSPLPLIPEPSNPEKQSTTNVPIQSSSPKRIQSKTKPGTAPLDKITYEKTWSHNGDVKQKCSLEIWLPKAGSDDEEEHTDRIPSPDPNIQEKTTPSPHSTSNKSRRSSTMKMSTTTTTAYSETKSLDETSPKRSEPVVVPRVYHYEDYLTDPAEERPRSGKSGNTNKSDINGSKKNSRRHRKRPNHRDISPSTNNTEDTVQSSPSTLPMSSKNLLANIKQSYSGNETKGSSSSPMINELMRKYSMIKKSHQELTQAKLQLEKPHHDGKQYTHISKDSSVSSPLGSDSASHPSNDHPKLSVRKLFSDTSPTQSTSDYNPTKLPDRRPTHHKPVYSDIYPQTRLFSIVNHLQQRQTTVGMSTAVLPAVIGRKQEEPFRSFERSKTLDVVFAIPIDDNPRIPARLPARPENPQSLPQSSNILQRLTNANEPIPARLSKRALPPPPHTLRSDQQTVQPLVQLVQYQNIQNSAQRYHHPSHPSSTTTTTTADVSTNKVLVHLKYSTGGNTDRNCLIPE